MGLLEQIKTAAAEAGRMIVEAGRDKDIITKEGRANYATDYDEKVQDYLMSTLRSLLPSAHFVGEEEGREAFPPEYEQGYTFVVDPIDGTSNFMRGYDLSVTSIGLLKDGKPYIGVVCDPYTDRLFYAQKGLGSYENGKRLFTSEDPLSISLVSMGTAPYYEDEMIRQAFDLGYWYIRRCLDIRRSGSAAFDLCMVASGRTGLFYEPVLQIWDYCAGALIVAEAGGKVTDFAGNPLSFRDKCSVCAATAGVSRQPYLPPC